ncbi:uncharacterized protein [Triticum aestivum]|uniref:uncharacterized protein n=1 Tax=Triticum aestivum TaxID=4565 RepID=UPI001D0075A8|nr:uncharacterized protein LOC123149292 [Triticum aestivum]
MEFKILDEAWAFWLSCGGQKGFEVRKRYTNKRSVDDKLIGLQRCDNNGVAQPTTTMEMGVQVIDVGLLRTYAEVIITGDDSRRPTNRTPLDRHGGGDYVARVALVALYPGCRRPQGLRLHVFPGRLRAGGLSRCVALYPGHRGQ